MAPSSENIISDVGKHLAKQSRPSKDSLIKSLHQAESALVVLEQRREEDKLPSLKPFIRPFSQSLVKHDLLHHRDKDVKLLVGVCFCEILRVLAPDPSFDNQTFKGIFELFISMFMELDDIKSPYFPRRVRVLETVASVRCFLRMLDLGCDNLILKMFKTFFSVVRQEHEKSVVDGMLSIMSLILNEEEAPRLLLEVVLLNLRTKGEAHTPAYYLAGALLKECEEKIKPIVCGLLTSCILDRESGKSVLKDYYHEIINEVFKCAPRLLVDVIPNLVHELLTDQVDVRIKSVNLIGKLLTLPKGHDIHEHHYLFVELLKRFSDKSSDVRISVIRAVKNCYLADPLGTESHKSLFALEGRLLDIDASVRAEAVGSICDLAILNLKNFPETHIACVANRLRDKSISVRKETLRRLMEVYQEYCTKCYEGQMMLSKCYEQIPCKVLMLSYDKNLKEFTPQALELLLARELFPTFLPVEDQTRHWVYMYSLFLPSHAKVLNLVLCQKRRFHKEMREYLSYRKKKETDLKDVNMITQKAITRMSATFPNPIAAEESFNELNKSSDNALFGILLHLLDEPLLSNAIAMREKLSEKTGKKSLHVEFLEALYVKCSHSIFSAEHVRHILRHISSIREKEDQLDQLSFNLLFDIIRSFPLLLRGSEHQFKSLIVKEDLPLCTKFVEMLANIGSCISIGLGEIYPLLERLSLEGTRAQAKAAMSAIAALVGPSEQSLVVDLCQKLVKSLHAGWNLPTVLQSLGCILQHFMSIFKSKESEVSFYIIENILKGKITENGQQVDKESTTDMSLDCKMKIYGLKTLVLGALPKKTDLHLGDQIRNVLDILSKALTTGEFSEGTTICEDDVAHIKLAAAISVLKLSRRWDLHISPNMFHSTILMVKDGPFSVRKAFIDKTHKLLKDHAASIRFASAFALAASDPVKDIQDASLKYLVDFVKECGRTAAISSTPNSEGSLTDSSAYVVVFLLHVLAHDVEFPTLSSQCEEDFARFCRPLVLLLQVLVNPQVVDGNLDLVTKNYLNLRSIFRAIKKAEDVIDSEKTPKLHILANIGRAVLDVIKPHDVDVSLAPDTVLLPSTLYTSSTRKAKEDRNCQIGFVVTRDFVRMLVTICKPDFSQISPSSVSHGHKHSKQSSLNQSTTNSNVSIKVDKLNNDSSSKRKFEEETSKIDSLQKCSEQKQQTALVCSTSGTLPIQDDDSSVIEELDADIGNSKYSGDILNNQLDADTSNLNYSGDIQNNQLDADISNSKYSGDVQNNQLDADISNSKYSGDIQNNQLDADISNSKYSGNIQNNQLDANISNSKYSGDIQNNQFEDSKSEGLELFGTVSDVSTEEGDVLLSATQPLGMKRKGSGGSGECLVKSKIGQYSSFDGSADSLLSHSVSEEECAVNTVDETINDAEKLGNGVRKRKVLLDTTNSSAANGLPKHHQQEKSGQRSIVDFLDISASEDSDVSKDAVAFRTRRRKV